MARPKIDDPEARAKIMAAAEELFAARGYSGTAIRDIAASAGVNGAMIHYYFGNKEGLYSEILRNAMVGVRTLIQESSRGIESSKERVTRFIEVYAAYIFSHPDFARIIHRELLSGGKHLNKALKETVGKNYTMLRQIINEGVHRGELRPVDIDLTPISLIGMVVFFQIAQPIVSAALGTGRYDERFVKRLSAHTADIFLKGTEASNHGASKSNAAVPMKKQRSAKRRA